MSVSSADISARVFSNSGPRASASSPFTVLALIMLAPPLLACAGPMWRRMHCLVCDFGLAAVNIEGSATGRGGTPGFWAPELVPLDGSGNPVPYWTEPCSDPPPPCRSNITDKADTWMWAATMLAILDRLDRMRTQGYAQFTAALGRGDGLERLLSNCLKPQVDFGTSPPSRLQT
jgi:hypothetical protein